MKAEEDATHTARSQSELPAVDMAEGSHERQVGSKKTRVNDQADLECFSFTRNNVAVNIFKLMIYKI